MGRLLITDEIVTNAKTSGRTVTDILAQTYASDIADMVSKNESLKKLDAFQLAMLDAGVSGRSIINDLYQTDGNEWLFPAYIDRRLRESVAGLNILPYLVGSNQTVAGTSIQGTKLVMDDKNKDAVRKKDVAEATDLPEAVMKLADTAYTLKKRGRAVSASYEAYMYMTIDMFGMHLDRIANDVAGQQAGDAIKVLVDGDGNSNPAPVKTIVGADGLTAEELAILAIEFWITAKLPLDTIVTGDKEFFKTLLLMSFNRDEVNGIIAGATFNFPQAQLTNLNVLYDDRVPVGAGSKAQLIALNKGQALTKYIAAGSQIREYDRNIKNQTHLGTVSEIAGFARFNDDATMILRAK